MRSGAGDKTLLGCFYYTLNIAQYVQNIFLQSQASPGLDLVGTLALIQHHCESQCPCRPAQYPEGWTVVGLGSFQV